MCTAEIMNVFRTLKTETLTSDMCHQMCMQAKPHRYVEGFRPLPDIKLPNKALMRPDSNRFVSKGSLKYGKVLDKLNENN